MIIRKQNLAGIKAVGSSSYYTAQEEKALDDLVLEKITSDYTMKDLICSDEVRSNLNYVINLGAIVSSKLGETSKNLSLLFKRAASEDSIIFLDEFDSIGKVRDYDHDHGIEFP